MKFKQCTSVAWHAIEHTEKKTMKIRTCFAAPAVAVKSSHEPGRKPQQPSFHYSRGRRPSFQKFISPLFFGPRAPFQVVRTRLIVKRPKNNVFSPDFRACVREAFLFCT